MRWLTTRAGTALCLVLLAGFLTAPSSASAYERRTLGGKYDVIVGWEAEPPYVDQLNGVSIRISQTGTNPAIPVSGAENSLKVQVRQGSQTREFPLRPVFGQNGYYVADMVPTREGDYQFAFTGDIGGTAVSETFDSANGKIGKVTAAETLDFPESLPSRLQESQKLSSASSDAQNSRIVGFIALGLAVLALVVTLATGSRRSGRL